MVTERLQQNPLAYDKDGEMHYDIISAFIKSIRGSDPDGAIYWLARMVEGGEDPAFIARRLVISAAEDIGLPSERLLLANACFETLMKIGWPEGRIPLAETTIYLATSPKSNSAYSAINDALELVRSTGNLACTSAFTQCSHQADEATGIWTRIQVRPQLRRQLREATILAGRAERKTNMATSEQCRRTEACRTDAAVMGRKV